MDINNKNKAIIVSGAPLSMYHQCKMQCEFFDDKFVLTAKREALFDRFAGKKFNIPYGKIKKINLIKLGVHQGVLLELNDDSIERPLFGRAFGMAMGGILGALLAGKGEFKFYFVRKGEREYFIETITKFNKSIEVQ